MRKLFKRCIVILVVIIEIVAMLPLSIAAEEVAESVFYEISIQVTNKTGNPSEITAMEQDGYLMVDFEEICELLDVEATGAYRVSDSPGKEDFDPFAYKSYTLGNHKYDILKGYKQFYSHYGFVPSINLKRDYESAFGVDLNNCDSTEGLSVQKYRNSNRIIFFRVGSDVAFFSDNIVAHLGTKVTKVQDHIMVPLVMFLNVLDSYAYVDSNTIMVGALEQTASDILSLTYLNSYYFDIVGDGYVSREDFWKSNKFIGTYRKLKNLFQGTLSLDLKKIKESYPKDTSTIAESIAQQLCTSSLEEKEVVGQYVSKQSLNVDVTKAFSDAWTDLFFSKKDGVINKAAQSIYNQVVADWEFSNIEFDNAAFSSTNARIENYIRFQKEMAEELVENKATLSEISKASKAVEVTSKTLGVALTGTLSYYTSAYRIEHAQQNNVDAIKKYLEQYYSLYEKVGSVGDVRPGIMPSGQYDIENWPLDEYAREYRILQSSKTFMDVVDENTKLYDGKSKNIFENKELRDNVFSDVGNAVIGLGLGGVLNTVAPELISGTWLGAFISLAPSIVEIIVNKVSGGAVDSKDALFESIYTMSFEEDAILLSNGGSPFDKIQDMDTRRKLAWTKLKLFYLTRMQYAVFRYGKNMEQFREEQPVMASECDQLLLMMSVLLYGMDGATQESLEMSAKKAKDCNDALRTVIFENNDKNADQEGVSEEVDINALYEQTIADYDKMMHEGQISYREKNRDTYEEADRYTYYTIVDIDGNGVDELILRFDHQDANHWTNQDSGYGESTYIYTVKDGVVVNVLLPESSVQGFAPDFVHLGFTKIYKGTNLINRGMYHLPQDDIFYSYQDGVLSKDPVLEITRGHDTWLINHEKKTPEECIEAYNTAANNDEGYELQLYEREIVSNSTGDNNTSSLIEEYIQFIKAKNDGSDFQNYIIYDIDKDGYPELLILVGIPEERRSVYEIYSYKSGRFEFQTQCKNCLPHGPAAYASYPDGNGMIAHFSFKGAEGVFLLSLSGHEIVDEPLYSEKLENHPTQYYLDEYDQYYQDSYNHNNYINHQFYVGENASPYYDGSYLLGQSAMDDFTAVYEAFGVEEETDASTEKSNNKFMGISKLDPGVEISTTTIGNTYRIRYDYSGGDNEYGELKLSVNNSAESYRLDAVYYPEIENV